MKPKFQRLAGLLGLLLVVALFAVCLGCASGLVQPAPQPVPVQPADEPEGESPEQSLPAGALP